MGASLISRVYLYWRHHGRNPLIQILDTTCSSYWKSQLQFYVAGAYHFQSNIKVVCEYSKSHLDEQTRHLPATTNGKADLWNLACRGVGEKSDTKSDILQYGMFFSIAGSVSICLSGLEKTSLGMTSIYWEFLEDSLYFFGILCCCVQRAICPCCSKPRKSLCYATKRPVDLGRFVSPRYSGPRPLNITIWHVAHAD